MKKIIRLTESDLQNIVKESVNRILKERRGGDFGGPDADLHDLYPDDFPEEDEKDPLDSYDEWRQDNMGRK